MTEQEILKELEQEAKEDRLNNYIYEWFSLNPNVLVLKQQLKTSNMNSTIKLLNETISHKKEAVKYLEKQKDALIRNVSRMQQSIDETNNEIGTLESNLKTIYEQITKTKYGQDAMNKSCQDNGASLNSSKNIQDACSSFENFSGIHTDKKV